MPVLTVPFGNDGPIISLLIGVSIARREALLASGAIPPAHLTCRFLVDTGASSSCVDNTIVDALGIPPIGHAWMQSASTGAKVEQRNTYDVSIWLPVEGAELHLLAGTMNVVASPFRGSGVDGLFGRDLLSTCRLEYDGPGKRVGLKLPG